MALGKEAYLLPSPICSREGGKGGGYWSKTGLRYSHGTIDLPSMGGYNKGQPTNCGQGRRTRKMDLTDTIPSWDEAESLIALHAAAREDNMIKNQEETRPTHNEEDENSLCNLKDRLERAMHRLSEEAWWPGHERNHSLESELLIFQDEIWACMSAMPPHEAMRWLGAHMGSLEYLHARTARERWHTLRTLVGLRGSADYTADLVEDGTSPTPNAPTPTAPTEEDDEIPWDDDEDSFGLKGRAVRALYRLSDEARWPGHERNYSLEHEIETFQEMLEDRLNGMPPHEAMRWLEDNIGVLQSILARTEDERQYALRKLAAIRGGLEYTADHIAAANAPTPNAPTPTAPTEEDDEIPWDDDDDQDDEEFHAAATREIVEAYRATAMSQRDLLLARFRGACTRLGAEAACTARGHPWGRGLNAQLGQLAGRVEFCLKGLCPIDASAWLEGNIGELEGLTARNKQEYDHAGLVVASLDDRLFGLVYDLARER